MRPASKNRKAALQGHLAKERPDINLMRLLSAPFLYTDTQQSVSDEQLLMLTQQSLLLTVNLGKRPIIHWENMPIN